MKKTLKKIIYALRELCPGDDGCPGPDESPQRELGR